MEGGGYSWPLDTDDVGLIPTGLPTVNYMTLGKSVSFFLTWSASSVLLEY